MIKRIFILLLPTWALFLPLQGTTTVDPANHFAYAANAGWVEAGDPSSGAVVGQAFCSGYLYGANIGWIHLGDGVPDNGYAYGNFDGIDYGVNHDGKGGLTGLAYGANVGWLVFEQAFGMPRVDLLTGNLSGRIWCPNIGWIDLSTSQSGVRTAWMDSGPDLDGDTIPDHWEYQWIGNLSDLGTGDRDGDGRSDVAEFEANTNPFDPSNFFRIVYFGKIGLDEALVWDVSPGRAYTIYGALDLAPGTTWELTDGPYLSDSYGSITAWFRPSLEPLRFYRVEVHPPLLP